MLVTISYLCAFIVSMFMLGHIATSSRHHNNMHFIFFCVLVSISLFGYLVIASSKSLDAAIVGIQLSYLGRCYLELSALLILCNFCRVRPSRFLTIPLGILCSAVLICTFTIGRTDLFYKDAVLVREQGYAYVSYQEGIAHYFFYGLLVLLFFIFFGVVIYAKRHDRKVSTSNCRRIIAIMSIGVLVFLVQTISGLKISLYPYAYLFMEILMILMVRSMDLHDINSNIVAHMLKQNDYGYIFVDMKRRFLGSNETAERLLPQISDLKMEKEFVSADLPVTINMSNWMDELDHMEEAHSFVRRIFDDNRTLRCKVRPLHYGKKSKQVGYTIIISDDTQQQKYINLLNNYNSSLEHEVQEKVTHIADMRDSILLSIANIVENRDFSTGDHIKRTSHTVRLFMDYLKRNQPEVLKTYELTDAIWKAAPMHDLGKLAIRDYILQKPGVYTKEEYEEMKQHSAKGAKIVKEVFAGIEDDEFVETAVNIAHYHHEKWDGTGYPCGISRNQIPVEARVMALADVFDALVSERCYKVAMSYEEAFGVIEKSLGTHFDPVLGKYFLACRFELVHLYEAANA